MDDDQSDADEVTQQQSLSDDEGGKPQESVAYCLVACAQRLEQSNHLGTFQDDDKQSANHGESCHAHHQHEDNPHVDVEQFEPREYLRIGVVDILRGIGLPIFVTVVVHQPLHGMCRLVQLVEVFNENLRPTALVSLPAIQSDGYAVVGEAEQMVELRHVRLVDT